MRWPVVIAVFFVAAAPAYATPLTITLTTFPNTVGGSSLVSSGWWSDVISQGVTNDNYLTGFFHGSFSAGIHRGFFSFTVPDFEGVVSAARLEIYTGGYLSSDSHETVGFFDVETNPLVLNAKGTIDLDIFSDLGGGAQYGTFALDGSNARTTVGVELNSLAFQDIGAARGGVFSIGASLLTLSANPVGTEAVFAGTGTRTNRLVLTIVPEPSTAALLAVGLIALARGRRRLPRTW